MLALLLLVGIAVSGYANPITDPTVDGAQVRDEFANNLVKCVKEKRSSYNQATKMFSGDAITNEAVTGCLKQAMEDLRPYMSTGIDSLGIKPTDPLMIDNLDINRDIPPLTIRTKISNVAVRGLSTFVARKVAVDIKKKTLQMVITVPKLYIKGDYNTDSVLAIVTVKGEGPFTANMTKITGDGRATIRVVCGKTINGKPDQAILMVEKATFDFNIAKSSMRLENLFPGKKALAKVADDFLNSEDFNKMVQREVKPQILLEVNSMFEEVMNSALAQFPVNEYLQETGHSDEC